MTRANWQLKLVVAPIMTVLLVPAVTGMIITHRMRFLEIYGIACTTKHPRQQTAIRGPFNRTEYNTCSLQSQLFHSDLVGRRQDKIVSLGGNLHRHGFMKSGSALLQSIS